MRPEHGSAEQAALGDLGQAIEFVAENRNRRGTAVPGRRRGWAAVLLATACLAVAPRGWGVPAAGEVFLAEQPDGRLIELRLLGDEHFSWHETIDGYVVEQDEVDHQHGDP